MAMKQPTGPELAEIARRVRIETIRLHKLCPETRLASSLSCVEILTALHYGGVRVFDPKNPLWEERDRFIISKGHGTISFYPILADLGFIPPDELEKISLPDGVLTVIPDTKIAGYETVNGSLGHGPGVGCGTAMGLKAKEMAQSVFVLLGDGELFEGSVWEAVMFAGQQKLDNLILVVDKNGASLLDFCKNIIDLDPLAEKLRSFGWEATEVDGHDAGAVRDALLKAKNTREGKPKAVIANTLKGKGVPKLEADCMSHIRVLKPEEADAAMEALI